MKVIVLDAEAAAALARAVARERRRGALTGQEWSTATRQLRARTGQDGPTLDGGTTVMEDGGVPELFTLTETAELLRLGLTSVKRLVNDGRLPVVHVGAAVRVRPADLRRFVDGLAETERPA